MKLTALILKEIIQQELKTIILEQRGGAPSLTDAARARGRIVPGHRGPQVVDVQKRVGARPDGIYGPNTRAKVGAFQKRCGIYVDGIVGEDTATVLLDPRRCGVAPGAAEKEPEAAAIASEPEAPTLSQEQLDFAMELSDHLEDAMSGLGTDEDKIWYVIKQGTSEPELMGAVVEFFEKNHGMNWTDGDLEGALGEEIENASTRYKMMTAISRALKVAGPKPPNWYQKMFGELGSGGAAALGTVAGAAVGMPWFGAVGAGAAGGALGKYSTRGSPEHKAAYRRSQIKKPPTKK